MVYPGLQQLSSFMAMNAEKHAKAFTEQILRVAKGEASDHDKHNKFYDEYLAVMDMTAEFYLSTVERIFKNLEIAQNRFTVTASASISARSQPSPSRRSRAARTTSRRPANASRRSTLLHRPAGCEEGELPGAESAQAITASSPARAGATTSARWCSTSSTPTATCPRRR
jgi:hypothetical protein